MAKYIKTKFRIDRVFLSAKMNMLTVILFVIYSYAVDVNGFLPGIQGKIDTFDIENYVTNFGYPFEKHHVITEDKYILEIHRVPHGKNNSQTGKKPVVFLGHGFPSSAADFFIIGPEKSLAFLLADAGYDVWAGNNRGNTWSRRHVDLDPDTNKEFWDFSFHELGVYDSPAMVDYILNATGNDKISYVAHSVGTTQFFVMAAEKPEYNDKITIMAALAPVAYMSRLESPFMKFVASNPILTQIMSDVFHVTEFFSHSPLITTGGALICSDGSPLQEICASLWFAFCGTDSEQLNRTIIPDILRVIPAGASFKEPKHLAQEITSAHFRQYDYGVAENLVRYKNFVPPDYDLAKITAPVALYYGHNDLVVGIPDVDQLAEELGNLVEKNLLEYKLFNHADFLFAKDVNFLLNFDVIKLLNKYNGL